MTLLILEKKPDITICSGLSFEANENETKTFQIFSSKFCGDFFVK